MHHIYIICIYNIYTIYICLVLFCARATKRRTSFRKQLSQSTAVPFLGSTRSSSSGKCRWPPPSDSGTLDLKELLETEFNHIRYGTVTYDTYTCMYNMLTYIQYLKSYVYLVLYI